MSDPAPFTSGPLDAEFVLIGEAPGASEASRGGAFTGPAGELLTSLLSSAGISRNRCRFENVFQFHPTANDLKPYISFNSRGQAAETRTYLKYRDALKERLSKTSANVIIPLGNIAMYALTGIHGIVKARGSIYDSTLLPGRKCIPTIHPSAALRFGQATKFLEGQRKKAVDPYVYRYWIVNDLKRALDNAAFPERRLPKRDLLVEPSMTDVRAFCNAAHGQRIIAFDIEATRGEHSEVTHIALALSSTQAISIPLVQGQQDYWPPDQEAEVWQLIAKVLEDTSVTKVAQNAVFDVSFLYRRHEIITAPIEDTMIATAILYPDFPAGLDFLVSIYCNGEPYYKDDGKQWMKNPFGSENIFREYNAKDAAVLLEILPQQLEDLDKIGNLTAYNDQKRLVYPLTYAASRGVLMNLSKLGDLREQSDKDIAALEKAWNAACRATVNPNSAPQIQQYFYTTLRHKPYIRNGRITCDDKALKRLAAKGVDEAKILLKYRAATKLKGTYLDMSFDTDNRIRCAYNPVGTEQGRISSSKNIFGTGGNQQNQPPAMKALQVADPGYILVNQDLGQAENRVVAYISGEAAMIEAFEKKIDIHRQTAAMIYGVAMEDVSEEQRDWGKRANHGLNYDLGYKSFAMYYQIEATEANHIVERYHAVYPGVREWHASIRDELNRNGRTLINCLGRRRVFKGRWNHDLFKVAYSYVPQSTVAAKMNLDGVCYLYERQDLFPEVEFLNTVHDSIQYQVPLAAGLWRVVEIIKELKKSLERPLEWRGRTFAVPVDTELGFNFNKKTMLEWKASTVESTDESRLAEGLEQYVNGSARAA
jgi:uracil-DNA glycosylase family 4